MGQFLQNAAKSTEQMEMFTKAVHDSGKASFEIFRNIFEAGKNQHSGNNPIANAKDMESYYRDWLKMWGVRPEKDFDALLEENLTLKKQLREKDDIIKNLTIMLNAKGAIEEDFMKNWDTLMKGQTDIYSRMMEQFFNPAKKTGEKTE